MTDILSESVLTTAAAAAYLRGNIPTTRFGPSVIYRWAIDCRLGADGRRVFLDHARAGRRMLTSRQALSRFCPEACQRRRRVTGTGRNRDRC